MWEVTPELRWFVNAIGDKVLQQKWQGVHYVAVTQGAQSVAEKRVELDRVEWREVPTVY